MLNSKSGYFKWRERLRFNPAVSKLIYLVQSLWYSNTGAFRKEVKRRARRTSQRGSGVALCCRIRDEGRYLDEFVQYYLAAGVDHFFFYEKLSLDNFRAVLAKYIDQELVTLYESWPHVPVSPAAEEDCLRHSLGRFRWVGFIDADEFVVIRDGRSIGEFLDAYEDCPAVALHWHMFGSNGHRSRPTGPVIAEYTRRESGPNVHVKCFVRPEEVTGYRNPHSWYYRRMQFAVTEMRRTVGGSISVPATAEHAWINHYHFKSDQDYFEKAARKSVHDRVTMQFETRSQEKHTNGLNQSNAVFDDSALRYYLERCRILGWRPSIHNLARLNTAEVLNA